MKIGFISSMLVANIAFAQSTLTPGIKASMDIAVLEQAKDAYFDTVVQIINNLQIPDFEDSDGNYLRGNSFVMDERSSNVSIYTDVPNNALVMRCDKMSGVFYNNEFRYKSWPFVAKGHIEVIINTIEIGFGLQFNTQVLPDGRTVPAISGVDISTDIDRWDVNIKIYGNIWSDFASAFEVFFVGTVVDIINDSLYTALQTGIPQYSTAELAKNNGYIPIPVYPNWTLDWETRDRAIVTDKYFGVGVKGLLFDKLIGEEEPAGVVIPEMPVHLDDHTQQFQGFVSSFSLDTFFSSWLEVGTIQGWYNAQMVPPTAQFQLTTTDCNFFLPGIQSYYGANRPIDLHFKIIELGQIGITAANNQMSGVGTLQVQFWVEKEDGTKEMATQVTLSKTSFGFTALVNNMDVSIQISQVNSSNLTVDSCTFGHLSAITLKLELNNFLRIYMGHINNWLVGEPITVPSNIAGLFELSNLTLEYFDNYVYAGATPTFIPPAIFALQ